MLWTFVLYELLIRNYKICLRLPYLLDFTAAFVGYIIIKLLLLINCNNKLLQTKTYILKIYSFTHTPFIQWYLRCMGMDAVCFFLPYLFYFTAAFMGYPILLNYLITFINKLLQC